MKWNTSVTRQFVHIFSWLDIEYSCSYMNSAFHCNDTSFSVYFAAAIFKLRKKFIFGFLEFKSKFSDRTHFIVLLRFIDVHMIWEYVVHGFDSDMLKGSNADMPEG